MTTFRQKIKTTCWAIKTNLQMSPVIPLLFLQGIPVDIWPPLQALYLGRAVNALAGFSTGSVTTGEVVTVLLILFGIKVAAWIWWYFGTLLQMANQSPLGIKNGEKIIRVAQNIPIKNFEDAEFCDRYDFAYDGFYSIQHAGSGLFSFTGSLIGFIIEGGVNLSGGQWQKIAIARTLFREDAKLIILDEPTAALDPQSESVVYRRFIEKMNNQTAILISHRLGATKFAGRILVFEQGRIVEEGTHADLMARQGVYYTMYTAQAGMYKE